MKRSAELSSADWRYLTRASIELLTARLRFAMTPSQAIVRRLEQRSLAKRHQAQANSGAIDLARVSWAIAAVSARVPWRSDCLIQAMAADRWLRRHGVLPEFYLGVTTTRFGAFAAHAWLRCGDVTVTGGAADAYTPLIGPR